MYKLSSFLILIFIYWTNIYRHCTKHWEYSSKQQIKIPDLMEFILNYHYAILTSNRT